VLFGELSLEEAMDLSQDRLLFDLEIHRLHTSSYNDSDIIKKNRTVTRTLSDYKIKILMQLYIQETTNMS
jgi:hypothetical protein